MTSTCPIDEWGKRGSSVDGASTAAAPGISWRDLPKPENTVSLQTFRVNSYGQTMALEPRYPSS
jgi:hypothetical protein